MCFLKVFMSLALLLPRLGGTEGHKILKTLWKARINPEMSLGQKEQQLNVCILSPELTARRLFFFIIIFFSAQG